MTAENQKRWINLGKVFLASLLLFLLVKTSLLNLQLLGRIIHQPMFFLGFVIVIFTVVLITAWRWHLLSHVQQVSLGFKKTIKPAYLGSAFNTLLGSVTGDFIRCHYVFKKMPDRKSMILLTVVFDRVMGLIGILITLVIAALLRITYIAEQPKLFYLIIFVLSAAAGGLLVILSFMLFPQYLNVSVWLRKLSPHNKLILWIASCLDLFQQYRIPKNVLLKAIIVSIISEYLLVVGLLITAKMMGLPAINFSEIVLALGITLLVSMVPVTPGGIGVGEMAFANILLLFNPGGTIAYATIYLGYRLLNMLAYLPVVLFYFPRLRLKVHGT